MKYLAKTALFAAILAAGAPAMALTASQTVQKEVRVTQADGTETISYQAADLVVPGERIVYTLNYNNDKAEPASNLVLTMPVPEVVNYEDGTADRDGTSVVYSADGGKTFKSRDALMVQALNNELRKASAEDITHIRWTIKGPVNPGSSGALVFKGILK